MKNVIKAMIVLLLFLGVRHFCLKQTKGFTLAAITPRHAPLFLESGLTKEETAELEKALCQKYTYLDQGGQAFVFLSADERYVIKFLKQHFFNVPFWYHSLAFVPYYSKKRQHRENKLQKDFNSYQMAFSHFKEESGLIYVHLHPTNFIPKPFILVDPLHIEHALDLNAFDFIVQKKANLLYSQINAFMASDQVLKAKKAISSVLSLLRSLHRKGFYDRDTNLITNIGLIDETAIAIDIGKFTQKRGSKGEEVASPTKVACERILFIEKPSV